MTALSKIRDAFISLIAAWDNEVSEIKTMNPTEFSAHAKPHQNRPRTTEIRILFEYNSPGPAEQPRKKK
jgi:hypothetical protein